MQGVRPAARRGIMLRRLHGQTKGHEALRIPAAGRSGSLGGDVMAGLDSQAAGLLHA